MAKPLNKRYSSYYVLIYYFEEHRFSVLRLKDVVTATTIEYLENPDLSEWDPKQSVESRFGEEKYPARFLQFGLNKKSMEKVVDDLIANKISEDEVLRIQVEELSQKRKREKSVNETSCRDTKKTAKDLKGDKRETERILLSKVKNLITAKGSDEKRECCSKCVFLQEKLDVVVQENIEKDKEIAQLKANNLNLQEKKKKLKEKYKNLKKSSSIDSSTIEYKSEAIMIGPTVAIDSYKLSCCRVNDFSKFTSDLLDVVFGPEILGVSVLKGIAGCRKISVLYETAVCEIQNFVSKKFNASPHQVRASIRQKLNVCHKAYKKLHANDTFSIIPEID